MMLLLRARACVCVLVPKKRVGGNRRERRLIYFRLSVLLYRIEHARGGATRAFPPLCCDRAQHHSPATFYNNYNIHIVVVCVGGKRRVPPGFFSPPIIHRRVSPKPYTASVAVKKREKKKIVSLYYLATGTLYRFV